MTVIHILMAQHYLYNNRFTYYVIGSFHVKSSGDFHGPPPILLKFGTLVGIV